MLFQVDAEKILFDNKVTGLRRGLMEKVKQQHYVPRMYLNRFGYISRGVKKLTVLKLDDGVVLENQRAENFASVNCFYDAEREELVKSLCVMI